MTARGRLVALEGSEGCGKSTQAQLLARSLGALLTREPGGTAVGQRIRDLVLGRDLEGPNSRTEALLLAADRAQHVVSVVEPALAAGSWVVSDRFTGSYLAYQGYGRGLDLAELKRISGWASESTWPDLNVLLELDEELARGRRCRERDRFEAEEDAFHQRVHDGYGALVRSDPQHWVVVDADGDRDTVARLVLDAVTARLGRAS